MERDQARQQPISCSSYEAVVAMFKSLRNILGAAKKLEDAYRRIDELSETLTHAQVERDQARQRVGELATDLAKMRSNAGQLKELLAMQQATLADAGQVARDLVGKDFLEGGSSGRKAKD